MKVILAFALAAMAVFAELTPEQKVVQFRQLAGLYAKNYAPYEWKRDTQNFDLLHISPWLERARATKDDLDFADLMMEYVAKLNDGHDLLYLRSSYNAYLGFSVDYYDGKPLIDYIDRSLLPRARFNFDAGDELVSIDGQTAAQMVERFWKYGVAANDTATRRFAAEFFTYRPQYSIPRAHEIGASAEVVIRRNGEPVTVTVPWDKVGTPMLSFGTLPNPMISARRKAAEQDGGGTDRNAWFRNLQNMRTPRGKASRHYRAINGFGSRTPIFALPAGFVQRLGRSAFDGFFSGTYQSEGLRIGYIRIPDFEPVIPALAANQLASEVAFMQANTDGLVVDVSRNPGGYVDVANFYASAFMTDYYRVTGFELRATSTWIYYFSQSLQDSINSGDPQWVVDYWQSTLDVIKAANAQNRGRTGAIPLDYGPDFEPSLDRPPLRNARGQNLAYTKPLIVLADELTASGGDSFTSMMQDAKRGPVVGTRTMGLGGTVDYFSTEGYSEVDTSITTGLMVRQQAISTGGEFPLTYYIENVGVRPDIVNEYMTEENLRNSGRPFVAAFTKAIVDQINGSNQPKETER